MSTIRQGVLVDAIASGMPIAAAGRLAGYRSQQNADDAYRSIRTKMIEDLGEIGVGTRALALKIKEKLDAKETKLFQKDGIVTDAVDLEAHGVQLHAVELAADILGLRGEQGSTQIGNVNILWAGGQPTWANPSINADANIKDNLPVNNTDSTVGNNQSVNSGESVPEVQSKVLEAARPPLSARTVPAPAAQGVLTQKVKKKRGPRLPGWRKK